MTEYRSGLTQKNEVLPVRAHVIIKFALLFGTTSLVAFGTFLVAPPFGIVHLQLQPTAVLIWDGILCLLFFFQHSYMIRLSARTHLERIIPAHYFGAVYTVASGCAIFTLLLLWQESGIYVYILPASLKWGGRFLAVLALIGVFWSVIALRSFDSFGIRSIKERFGVVKPRSIIISNRGPYGYTRHPIYFCALVLFWTNSSMSAERLLFNMLFSIWIVVATRLEERDLLSELGQEYRDYQTKVPMLVPSLATLFRKQVEM